jgi:hypothetical protein
VLAFARVERAGVQSNFCDGAMPKLIAAMKASEKTS